MKTTHLIDLANYRLTKLRERENQMSTMQRVSQLPAESSTIQAQGSTSVQPYFPSENDWKMMLSWGSSALKSGFLPVAIKTAEQAAIIALKGRELGIPFMQAISHIHVISGKPCMSAEMLQALARRNLPGLTINIIESTFEKATVEFTRPEKGSKPYTISFSIEDAKRADLLNKDVWKKYPGAMLWSRAISAGLRKVCPEALMGVSYTPEELGKEVDEGGNVIETSHRNLEENNQATSVTIPLTNGEKKVSEAQIKRLYAIQNQCKLTKPSVVKYMKELFGREHYEDLRLGEYDQLIDDMQAGEIPTPMESAVAAVEDPLREKRKGIWNQWKQYGGTQAGFERFLDVVFGVKSGKDLSEQDLKAVEMYINKQLNSKPPQPLDPAEKESKSDPGLESFEHYR